MFITQTLQQSSYISKLLLKHQSLTTNYFLDTVTLYNSTLYQHINPEISLIEHFYTSISFAEKVNTTGFHL